MNPFKFNMWVKLARIGSLKAALVIVAYRLAWISTERN